MQIIRELEATEKGDLDAMADDIPHNLLLQRRKCSFLATLVSQSSPFRKRG